MHERGRIGIDDSNVDLLGRPSTRVQHRSQQDALKFLKDALDDTRGVGVLHGPKQAGKSVVIERLVQEIPDNVAVAVVDGTELKPSEFLSSVLEQFGYPVRLNSDDELLNMLRVIAVQQTRSHQSPIIIVKHINAMSPDTLCVLCNLAALKIQDRFAVRIILVTDRFFCRIIDSPSMGSIAARLVGNFELKPMNSHESMSYLYARLRSRGIDRPDDIFPLEVCSALHDASDGWPGKLDEIMSSVLEQVNRFPVRVEDIRHPAFGNALPEPLITSVKPESQQRPDIPRLIVTLDGEVIEQVDLEKTRALIGRSSLTDVVIPSEFVSRQHALLICDQGAVVIVDLKSSNGTFVNSRRISSKVLLDNDVIVIGDHRIKLHFEGALPRVELEEGDIGDTAEMRAISEAKEATIMNYLDFETLDKEA